MTLPEPAILLYLPVMDIDYLSWYIEHEKKLHHKKDTHVLMSSAVAEPTDMILEHLAQFREMARKYIDVSYAWGHELLKGNIASRYGANPDNITTTNGASNGIYLVCRALLEKRDRVIIETPCYEPLRASPSFIGARISFLERKPPNFLIDIDSLKGLIQPATKLIIFSNLHNPSGALIENETLVEIAEFAKSKNPGIKILIDEIYHDFLTEIPRPATTLDDCFITLSSLTKVYGLAIVHCGWVIADEEVIDRVRKLQVLVEGSYSRLLDSFSAFLIEHIDDYHQRSIKLISENLERVSQYMQPLIDNGIIQGALPRYGCVYFPKISLKLPAGELTRTLAEKHSIYVVPGRFFKQPNHIRIGFGGRTDKLSGDLEKLTEALLQYS